MKIPINTSGSSVSTPPETFGPLYEGASVRLRSVTKADLPRVAAWHQDPILFESLVGPFYDVSKEAAVLWMEQHWLNDPRQIRMAIFRSVDDVHIGNVYLVNIDRIYHSSEFGIFLGCKEDQGHGYGREATLLMLRHAFEVERLHRVELDVLVANTRAIHLYRSCGFREEGIRREAAFKRGRWIDVLHMAVLAQDYLAVNSGTQETSLCPDRSSKDKSRSQDSTPRQ